jgi:iron complex transport system permease protein
LEETLKNRNKVVLASVVILFICFVLSMSVGRYPLTIKSIFKLIKLRVIGCELEQALDQDYIVFWSVRLPRALMSLWVGAVLGISGTVFQGLFRNPLVSPDILGVSAGASFGAGLAIILIGTSAIAIQSFSFVFGFFAVVLAYRIGSYRARSSMTTMVLSGVIVSSLFSAGLSFLKYVADPYEQLPAIVFWTMGGFSNIVWKDIIKTFPVMTICAVALFLLRWKLNIMTLGDDDAKSLGVDVNKIRIVYIFLSTLMVASSISSCGTIGWVGLVVPHMARLIVGPDHFILLPFSALMGGGFMILMDTIARTITAGEIPISIITSFIGAPFLGYLMLKQEKSNFGE